MDGIDTKFVKLVSWATLCIYTLKRTMGMVYENEKKIFNLFFFLPLKLFGKMLW